MSSAKRRPCSKCGKNRAEKFYVSPRGRVCSFCKKRRTQYASREVRMLETHYITLEEYEALLAAQDGRCYICQREPKYNMDVDHDHAVERELLRQGVPRGLAHRRSIRGLLDKPCNRRLLPSCRDNAYVLKRAIKYLAEWPSHDVLGEAPAWVS